VAVAKKIIGTLAPRTDPTAGTVEKVVKATERRTLKAGLEVLPDTKAMVGSCMHRGL
jgi:hypothetical protein